MSCCRYARNVPPSGQPGTSGLSGLSLAGRPRLACGAPEVSALRQRAQAGYAPPGRMRMAGLAVVKEGRVVGASMVLKDQRTPVAAGPAPLSRMRAMRCSISGGTRRSPHHRCPQAVTGSVDCQRAPRNSVHQGTVARHSQLVGPRGPSHLHGRLGSERTLKDQA